MKLVQHKFEQKDNKCILTIYPAPSYFYDGDKEKPIDCKFSWHLKGYSAYNHPMQLFISKNGILSGELDTKSFGMKVLGFGELDDLVEIDYTNGSWSRNKNNNAVRYEEKSFGIEYKLNGSSLKQTIKINDVNFIKPICEKLYIQSDSHKINKSGRIKIFSNGMTSELTDANISLLENDTVVGQILPGFVYNKTNKLNLKYKIINRDSETFLITEVPEEVKNWEFPIYVDPSTSFGWTKNLGVCRRTFVGPNTVYTDHQHPSVDLDGGTAWEDVESPNYWVGAASPAINSNGILYADLYIPNKYKSVLKEISEITTRLKITANSGTGNAYTTILPFRIRPLNGTLSGSTFTPDFTMQRTGISPKVLFDFVSQLPTMNSNKEYQISTMSLVFSNADATIFNKDNVTAPSYNGNGRVAEIFNEVLNSDKESRFTAIVFTDGTKSITATTTPAGTSTIAFTLTWIANSTTGDHQPRTNNIHMSITEPSISVSPDISGINSFYTSMGVSTRDFRTAETDAIINNPDKKDPYRLDQRANVKDQYSFYDPQHRIFNHVPNPYFLRSLNGIKTSGVEISHVSDSPDYLKTTPLLESIKITCNSDVVSNQNNIHNVNSTENKHYILIPLHNLEFMKKHILQMWVKAEDNLGGNGWNGLILHGYDYENDKWAATKIEVDALSIGDYDYWKHCSISFTPSYTTSWLHSRTVAKYFNSAAEYNYIRTWNVSHPNQSIFGTKYSPYQSFLLLYNNNSATSGSIYLNGLCVSKIENSLLTGYPIEADLEEIDTKLDTTQYNSILERKNRIFQVPFRGSGLTDAITPRKTIATPTSINLSLLTSTTYELPYIPDPSSCVIFNAYDNSSLVYEIPEEPLDEGEIEFFYCPTKKLILRGTKKITNDGKYDPNGFLLRDSQQTNNMGNSFELSAGSQNYVFDNNPRHIFTLGNIPSYPSGNSSFDRDVFAGAGMSMFRINNSIVWQIRDPGHVWKNGVTNSANNEYGMTNNMGGASSRDKAVYNCQFDIPESMIAGSTNDFISTSGQLNSSSWMQIRLIWGPRMEMYVNGDLVDTNPHMGFIANAPMFERSLVTTDQQKYNNARVGLLNKLQFGNYALSYKSADTEPAGGEDLRHNTYDSSRGFNHICKSDDCIIQEFGISKKINSSIFDFGRLDDSNEIGSFNNNELITKGNVSLSISGVAPYSENLYIPISDITRYTSGNFVEYETYNKYFNYFNAGSLLDIIAETPSGVKLYLKGRNHTGTEANLIRFTAYYTENYLATSGVQSLDNELVGMSGLNFYSPYTNLKYNNYLPLDEDLLYCIKSDGTQGYIKNVVRNISSTESFQNIGSGSYNIEVVDTKHFIIKSDLNSNLVNYKTNELNGYEIAFDPSGSSYVIRDWKKFANGNILVSLDEPTSLSNSTEEIYCRQINWDCDITIKSNNLFGLNISKREKEIDSIDGQTINCFSCNLYDKGFVSETSNQGFAYHVNNKLKLGSPYTEPIGSNQSSVFTSSPYLCKIWFNGYWHITLSGSTSYNDFGIRISKEGFINPSASDIDIIEDRSNRFSIEGGGEWVLRPGGHLIFKADPDFVFQISKIWFGGTGATDSLLIAYNSTQFVFPTNDLTKKIIFNTPHQITKCYDSKSALCFTSEYNNEVSFRSYELPTRCNKWIIEGITKENDCGADITNPHNFEYGDFGATICIVGESGAISDYYARRHVTDGGTTENYEMVNAGGMYLTFHVSEQYAGTKLAGGHLYPNLFPLYSVNHSLTTSHTDGTWITTEPDLASNVVIKNANRWCRFPFNYSLSRKLYQFADDGTVYHDLNISRFIRFHGTARGSALTAPNQRGLLTVKLRLSGARYLQSDLNTTAKLESDQNIWRMSCVGEPITCREFAAKSKILSWVGANTYGQPGYNPCPELWFDGQFWNLRQKGSNIRNYSSQTLGLAGRGYPTLGGLMFRAIYGFEWNTTLPFTTNSVAKNLSDLLSIGEAFDFAGDKNRHPTCRLDLKDSGLTTILGAGYASYNSKYMITHPDTVSDNIPAAIGGAGYLQTSISLSNAGTYETYDSNPMSSDFYPWQNIVGHIRFKVEDISVSGNFLGIGIYKPHVAKIYTFPNSDPVGSYIPPRLIIGSEGYFQTIDQTDGSLHYWNGVAFISNATITPAPPADPLLDTDQDNRVYYNDIMTTSTTHVRVLQPQSYYVSVDIENDVYPKNNRDVLLIADALSGRRHLTYKVGSPNWIYKDMINIKSEHGDDGDFGSIAFGTSSCFMRKFDEEHLPKCIDKFLNTYASPIFRQSRIVGDDNSQYTVSDGGTFAVKIPIEAQSIVSASALNAVSDLGAPTSRYNKVCLSQTRDLELTLTNTGSLAKTYLAGQACLIWRHPSTAEVLFYATNTSEVTINGNESQILEFSAFEFQPGVYKDVQLEGVAIMELQYPTTEPIENPDESIYINNKFYIQRHPSTNIGLYLPESPISASERVFYINGDVYDGQTNYDDLRTTVNGNFYSYFYRTGSIYSSLSDKNFVEREPGSYTKIQKTITIGHPRPRFCMRIAYKDDSKGIIPFTSIPSTASIDLMSSTYSECRMEVNNGLRIYNLKDFYPTYTDDSSTNSLENGYFTFSSAHKFARVTARDMRSGFTDHDGTDFKVYLKGYINGLLEDDIECVGETSLDPMVTLIPEYAPTLSLSGVKLSSDDDVDGNQLNDSVLIEKDTNADFSIYLFSASGNYSRIKPYSLFVSVDPTKLTVNEFKNPDYTTEYSSPPAEINETTGDINLFSDWVSQNELFIHEFNGNYSNTHVDGVKTWYYKILDHKTGTDSKYNRDSNGCPYLYSREIGDITPSLIIYGPPVVSGITCIQDQEESGIINLSFHISTYGLESTADVLIGARNSDTAGQPYDRTWINSGYVDASGLSINNLAADQAYEDNGRFDSTIQDTPHFTFTISPSGNNVSLKIDMKNKYRHIYNSKNIFDGYTYQNMPYAANQQWTFYVRARRNSPIGGSYLYSSTSVNFKYHFADPNNLYIYHGTENYSTPNVSVSGFSASAVGSENYIDTLASGGKSYSLDGINWIDLSTEPSVISPLSFILPSGNEGWNSIYFRAKDIYENIGVKCHPRPWDIDDPIQDTMSIIPQYNDSNKKELDIYSGNNTVYARFPNFTEKTPFKWELLYSINSGIESSGVWHTYKDSYTNCIPIAKHVIDSNDAVIWRAFYAKNTIETKTPATSFLSWNAYKTDGTFISQTSVEDELDINVMKISTDATEFYIKNTDTSIILKPMYNETGYMNYFYLTTKIDSGRASIVEVGSQPNGVARLSWKNEGSSAEHYIYFKVYDDSIWHTYKVDLSGNTDWTSQRKTELKLTFYANNIDYNLVAQNPTINVYFAHFGISSQTDLVQTLVPIEIGNIDGDDYINFKSRLIDWKGTANEVVDSQTYYVIPITPSGVNVIHDKSTDGILKAKVLSISTTETADVEYRIRYRLNTSSTYDYMDGGNWHTIDEWESGIYVTQELTEGKLYLFSIQARNPNSTSRITSFSADTQFFSDYITPQVIYTSHFSDTNYLYQSNKNTVPANVTRPADTAQAQGAWQELYKWKQDEYGQYFKSDWNYNFYHTASGYLSNSIDHNIVCKIRNVVDGIGYNYQIINTHPVDGFFYKVTYGEENRDEITVEDTDSFEEGVTSLDRKVVYINELLQPDNGDNDGYKRNIAYIHIRPFYKIVNTRIPFDKKYQAHLAFYLDYNDNKHPLSSKIVDTYAKGINLDWNSDLLPSGLDSNIYTCAATIKPSLGIKVEDERPQFIKYVLLSKEEGESVYSSGVYSDFYNYLDANPSNRVPKEIISSGLYEHSLYKFNYKSMNNAGIEGPGINSSGNLTWSNKAWTMIRPAETIINIYPSGDFTYFKWSGLSNENVQNKLELYLPLNSDTSDKVYGKNFVNSNVYKELGGINGCMLFDGETSQLYRYSQGYFNNEEFAICFNISVKFNNKDSVIYCESRTTEDYKSCLIIGLKNNSENLYINVYNSDGDLILDHTSVATLDKDIFYSIAWLEQNGESILYINGIQDSSVSYTKEVIDTNRINIGALYTNEESSLYANILLDELRVFTGILSESEITDLYNNEFNPNIGYYEIWDWMNGIQIGKVNYLGQSEYEEKFELLGGIEGGYLIKAYNNDGLIYSDYEENKAWTSKPIRRSIYDNLTHSWKPNIYDYITHPIEESPIISIGYDSGTNQKYIKAYPKTNINQDSQNRYIYSLWSATSLPGSKHRIIASGILEANSSIYHNSTEYLFEAYEEDTRIGFVTGSGSVDVNYNNAYWKDLEEIKNQDYKSLSSLYYSIDPNKKYGFRVKCRNKNIVTLSNVIDSEYRVSDWSDKTYSYINVKSEDDYNKVLHIYTKHNDQTLSPSIYGSSKIIQDITTHFDTLKDFRISYKPLYSECSDLDILPKDVKSWIDAKWISQNYHTDKGNNKLLYIPESIVRLTIEASGNTTIRRTVDLWNSSHKNGITPSGWGITQNNYIDVDTDYGSANFETNSEYGNISNQEADQWYYLKWNLYDDILEGIDQLNGNGSLLSNNISWSDISSVRIQIETIASYASGIYNASDTTNLWRTTEDAKLLQIGHAGVLIRDCSIGWTEQVNRYGEKLYTEASWNGNYEWSVQPKNIIKNKKYELYSEQILESIKPMSKPIEYIEKKTIYQPSNIYKYNSYLKNILDD